MLGLDSPLLLFVDPELEDICTAERRARGVADLTHVVARPLEAVGTYARLSELQQLPTFLNADGAKDTPLFQVVNYAKFELLDEAIGQNPFGTDFFAWIDAAISHVAVPPVTFPAPSSPVALLEMRAVAPMEIIDRRAFYEYERGCLAGGFFRGDRRSLSNLIQLFRQELDEVIGSGLRPNEQQVLSYLSAGHPDLFAPYFGDYASILCNWDLVRRDVDTVLLNLEHCALRGLTSRFRELSDRLAESIDASAVIMTASQRERWLLIRETGASEAL